MAKVAELEAAQARIAEFERAQGMREEEVRVLRDRVAKANDRAAVAEAGQKETLLEFDDLKAKLAASEAENARMRGYIQRVQEDDVVREPLIDTGDPDGEMTKVPKRTPTTFFAGGSYAPQEGSSLYTENRTRPRKHWVNYGRRG